MHQQLDELWEVVRQIPAGNVMSYGDVGKHLSSRATGRMVGRWMAMCPDSNTIPWWRVVAASGILVIEKRGVGLATRQADELRKEGVTLQNDRVPSTAFLKELPNR